MCKHSRSGCVLLSKSLLRVTTLILTSNCLWWLIARRYAYAVLRRPRADTLLVFAGRVSVNECCSWNTCHCSADQGQRHDDCEWSLRCYVNVTMCCRRAGSLGANMRLIASPKCFNSNLPRKAEAAINLFHCVLGTEVRHEVVWCLRCGSRN